MMKFKPLEFHHLYWGALLIAASISLICKHHWPLTAALSGIVGLVAVIDDINQHWGNGTSVVHDLFMKCWHALFGNWWPFGAL